MNTKGTINVELQKQEDLSDGSKAEKIFLILSNPVTGQKHTFFMTLKGIAPLSPKQQEILREYLYDKLIEEGCTDPRDPKVVEELNMTILALKELAPSATPAPSSESNPDTVFNVRPDIVKLYENHTFIITEILSIAHNTEQVDEKIAQLKKIIEYNNSKFNIILQTLNNQKEVIKNKITAIKDEQITLDPEKLNETDIKYTKKMIDECKNWQHGIGMHFFKSEKIKWKEYHNYIVEEVLQKQFNLTPHRACASGGPFGHSSYTMTHQGTETKLDKFNYEGLRSYSCVVIQPNHIAEKNCAAYIAYSSLYSGVNAWGLENEIDDHMDAKVCFFIDDMHRSFDLAWFLELAGRLQKITGAHYGYYIRQPLEASPEMYVRGVDEISITEREYQRSRKWRIALDDFRLGKRATLYSKIRDVFKLNFLSNLQLEQKVGSQTLRAWIEESPTSRGSLHEISEHLTGWYIEDEKLIPDILQSLLAANLVVCTYDD